MEKELQKQRIKRNLIFWGKLAEKYVLVAMAMIVGYVFFFSYLGGGSYFKTNEIWSILFVYQMMLILISALMAPFSYGIYYIPLVMSFGSKRDETVWGLQLMNWLVLGEMGAFLLLFAGLSSRFGEWLDVVVWIAWICGTFGLALGQFVTAFGLRFGMKGIKIIGVIAVLLFTVMGGFLLIFIANNGVFFIKTHWLAAGAVIGGICYAGSVYLLLQVVRTYEVRR